MRVNTPPAARSDAAGREPTRPRGRGPLLMLHYLASNLITLFAFMLPRQAVFDRWIWAKRSRRRGFNYDLHGMVRIHSEVPLSELASFHTEAEIDRPDLRVKIGSAAKRSGGSNRAWGHGLFWYRQVLGRLGFWVEITRGECTHVVAGRLLRLSPHVLYTSVVEPMLRWTLVQRGYALTTLHPATGYGNAALFGRSRARVPAGSGLASMALLAVGASILLVAAVEGPRAPRGAPTPSAHDP